MIKITFLIVLFLLICVIQLYSQDTSISKHTGNIKLSIPPDTGKTFNKLDNDSLKNLNNVRSLRIFEYKPKPEEDILSFYYLPHFILKKSDSKKVKQEILKRNINDFLSRKYNEMPNYDLGVIGMYLKSARKITAIILAVLSL